MKGDGFGERWKEMMEWVCAYEREFCRWMCGGEGNRSEGEGEICGGEEMEERRGNGIKEREFYGWVRGIEGNLWRRQRKSG